jgi:hypothetical protein
MIIDLRNKDNHSPLVNNGSKFTEFAPKITRFNEQAQPGEQQMRMQLLSRSQLLKLKNGSDQDVNDDDKDCQSKLSSCEEILADDSDQELGQREKQEVSLPAQINIKPF